MRFDDSKCLDFLPKTYHQSKLKHTNFRRSSSILTLHLSSQQFITSEKLYYGPMNCVYYVMGMGFYQEMPCFIQSRSGISAVFSA